MHSYISFFKKIPAFTILVVLVITTEVTLSCIPDLYYLEPTGSFFTYYKRKVAENPSRTYDYIMFGDSRSLSINGSKEEGRTMYNFSLPAAGPRYFKYYLKKYLKHHNKKPKVVIWAADPEQYGMANSKTFDGDRQLWAQYRHRLLNLFSMTESSEQYEGYEWIFIMKEYLPNLLPSFKYREGLEGLLSGLKLETFKEGETFHSRRNKVVERDAEKNNGQVNLANYLEENFEKTFNANNSEFKKLAEDTLRQMAEKGLEESLHKLNIEGDYSLLPLSQFLEYCRQENIKVIVLNIPRAKGLNETKYFKKIQPLMKEEVAKFTNAAYIEFPEMDYDLSLFSEAIHYNSKGEKRLNEDFYNYIFPLIVQFGEEYR